LTRTADTLDYIPFENKYCVNQTDPSFLGVADDDRPPGDIDPKRSVLIGDLGPGSDQPIALDYRPSMDEPVPVHGPRVPAV
jgi:hypothetical protein